MLDLIRAIILIVIVSVILLVLLLGLFAVFVLVPIESWWRERHPKVSEPEKPSICPECGKQDFYYLKVSLCDGWDEAGNEIGWSEALGECRSCHARIAKINTEPWRGASEIEWNDYLRSIDALAHQSNKNDSYYSEDAPFAPRRKV